MLSRVTRFLGFSGQPRARHAKDHDILRDRDDDEMILEHGPIEDLDDAFFLAERVRLFNLILMTRTLTANFFLMETRKRVFGARTRKCLSGLCSIHLS